MTSIADAISDALFGTIGRDPHDLVPDLYEDLVIRQDGARFDDHGRFTGFGFELGIRRDARVADPEIRYKHVALYRLSRIAPIEIQRAQEGVNLVDLHRDLLYGLAQNAVHPLTVVGNDPARHGVLFSYGTACQAPRIACATADSGRDGPKARRANRTEQSAGSPPG